MREEAAPTLEEMVLAFSTTACKTRNMKNRSFWFTKVEESWQHGNAVWFSGLPRSGKSLIAQNLPQVEYFDCTLPVCAGLLSIH